MIRTANEKIVFTSGGDYKLMVELFCNAADTKPTTGITNGSSCIEVDTGKVFLFDEVASEWVEVQ